MKAYVFPGQGAQFPGMGKELYDQRPLARNLMEEANELLGFRITDIMFNGTPEDLKETRVTQPAVFLHSVVAALSSENFHPEMVAGHSLGEFSALVCNGVLSFRDGVTLVARRAAAMQKACDLKPSAMAAVLMLPDNVVEEICAAVTDEIVVAANYNCPGQLVISGSVLGVNTACEKLLAAGARRAVPLPVNGAFHSPFMAPAREELAQAIQATDFSPARCPVYQNVDARPVSDPVVIRKNLMDQLTAPVRWTQSVQAMVADGATEFIECGPGKVLQGLIGKIVPGTAARSV